MIGRPRVVPAVVAAVLAAVTAIGCSHSGTAPRTSAQSASASATGAHVRVLGLWSGPEYDSFKTVASVWEKNTGGIVDWQGVQDPAESLPAALGSGSPPDIAVLPNLAMVRQLAASHTLVPLDSVLDMTRVRADYAPAWIDLGSVGGKPYGIFYKLTDKATVWYSPAAFATARYRVPKTWTDLTALASKVVASGRAPFSVVAASGPAAGWPLTDWVSEIVLNKCGPDVYDQWVAAEIPWTQACIKQSFHMLIDLVRAKGYVFGGTQRILSTSDSDGADPLYTDPPGAYMYYLASFAQAFIAQKYPALRPGTDYSYFPFPTIDTRYNAAVTVGADILVMTHDTPAARSFLAYLAAAPAQQTWIKLGGFTSVNRAVAPSAYADPVARAVAAHLAGASIVRFSAGDMMPADLQRSWWADMLQLVKDPTQLDADLAALTKAAR